MGINGTFLFVCAERADVVALIPTRVRRFFELSEMALVNEEPLHFAVWQDDPHLFGVAISPPMFWDIRTRGDRTPWVLVADSEREPSVALARYLAEELAAPVVLSSCYDICDPPEPTQTAVFGAPPNERFDGLHDLALDYKHLAQPADSTNDPSFAPRAVVFLTFRAPAPLRAPPSPFTDDAPPF